MNREGAGMDRRMIGRLSAGGRCLEKWMRIRVRA